MRKLADLCRQGTCNQCGIPLFGYEKKVRKLCLMCEPLPERVGREKIIDKKIQPKPRVRAV